MKQTKKIIAAKNNVMKTANTVNHEGNAAWTKPDAELLEQFAMTGTLGNSFYASAKENTENATSLLERCTPESIATAIVKGRNDGFIRTFPILGLVYLSEKDTVLFKKTFPEIIKTGNDLIDFIELCKARRGLGRAVKSAISAWISANTNDYYAQKYRNQIADAIRLIRFKGDSDPIFGYVLAGYGNKVKGWTPEKEQSAYEKYPTLLAHNRFIEAINAGKITEACGILKENRLDVDSLTSCYDKFDANIWREIARLSPVMRFLKYLDKFDRSGVFKKDISLAEQKLTVANFQKARVFPFRLYTAFMNISNSDVRNHLASVLDEYSTAYDWGAFNEYSWAVCPDVSGSMHDPCENATLLPCIIAGMFTGFFAKGLKNCMVIPWSDTVFRWDVPRNDSVITHINNLNRLNGGTDMSCALRSMIANGIKRDFCVFITDTEEYGARMGGRSWIESWLEYRKRVNSRAKAFTLRVDTNPSNPVSEEDSQRYGVYPIYGWNDNIIKYMEYVVSHSK